MSRFARAFRCAHGGALLVLAAVLPAAAQTPAPPPRPAFQVVRFNENWGVLRQGVAPAGFDKLKYLQLSTGGSSWLSLGGQLRARSEAVSDFMLVDSPLNDDSFELVRLLLHADVHAGPYLRAFIEGKHAMAFDRALPGGRRPLDHDELELQNAFLEVTCCGAGPVGVTARVGRQELLLGSQRLVSPLDWTNTRRTFEGFRLTARVKSVALDGFLSRPVVVDTLEFNERDPATTFWGVALRPAAPAATFAWELYGLGLAYDGPAPLWGYTGTHDRFTLGARLTGALGSPLTRFDLEGGWQTGSLGASDVGAWFAASDLTRSFPNAPLKPTATVGFDYASGDADRADDVVGTFHQLYPLGHAYAGYMDLLGRQNLIEARGVLTAAPIAALALRASVHRFLRAELGDGAYNVAGGVLRPALGTERAIGTELDLTSGWQLNRHTRIELGYGHFWPGAFLTGSSGTPGAVGSDWGYASTGFTF
jgi:hypothetical protein